MLLLPAMRGYRTTGALIVIIVAYCASCVEAAGRSPACPVWSTGDCKCGDSIGGIVRCDEETGRVSVHFGYCMTLMNDSDPSEGTIVGRCPLSTINVSESTYISIDSIDENSSMCSPYRKDGPLCGSCETGTGMSFTLTDYGKCLDCTQSSFNRVWAVFAAVQLLPPTAMFLFILFARIRASSPILNSMVFFCQMMAYPNPLNTISYAADISHDYTNYLFLLYNLWSMMIVLPNGYGDVCLDQSITFLRASLINYGVCLYVFTLMIVIYSCIFCYNRGYRPIRCLLQPLLKCVTCIQSPWNIEGTLIDVLITMVVLMYWRVTMITVGILQPTTVYGSNGKILWIGHYFEASQKMFDIKNNLEIVMTLFAIVVLGILLFHPFLLACYQFRFLHIFLNKCSCRRVRLLQLYTKTFADSLQNSFKDGTNGTRDYRFFASFYFLMRLVGAYIYITEPLWSSIVLSILFLILLLLVCWFQPHKLAVHNFLDGLVYGLFVLIHTLHTAIQLEWNVSDDLYSTEQETGITLTFFKITIAVAFTIPLAYFIMRIFYWVVIRCRVIQRGFENTNICCRNNNNLEFYTESVQVDRYQALYPSSTAVDTVGMDQRARDPIRQPSSRYGTVTL